jgi:hypothetical protein
LVCARGECVRDVGFVDAEFGGKFGHGDAEAAYLGAEFVCALVAYIPYRSASVHGLAPLARGVSKMPRALLLGNIIPCGVGACQGLDRGVV